MNAPFPTRSAAEAWRAANPTPAPAQPIEAPGLSAGLLRLTLTLLGALALGVAGWALH